MFWARTGVGGSIGCWQVGTSLPGLGFEALLAALAVLTSGVVFTLALEVSILQQALGSMEVTFTPKKKRKLIISCVCVGVLVGGTECVPLNSKTLVVSFLQKLKKNIYTHKC